MFDLNEKHQLFSLLEQGAWLITPNNRLSTHLLRDYFLYKKSEVLDKPFCFPYNLFLVQLYQRLQFSKPLPTYPLLLNEAQYRHLWQQLIQANPALPYSEGLLRALMQAYESCQLWNLSPQDLGFYSNNQTQVFQNLWSAFNQKLKDLNLMTSQQLVPYFIERGASVGQQGLIWACFDEFTPQQKALQTHLQQQGQNQYVYDLKPKAHQPQLFAAEDPQQEYEQLMAWLDLRLSQGDQRIAVVIPNLQEEFASFQRLIKQQLDDSLYDFSLGEPLSQFPLIAHALCWLNLNPQRLTHQELCLLLQSPYLEAAEEEFLERSQCLQDSQLVHHQTVSLKKWIKELDTQAPKLSALLAGIKPYPKTASIQEWTRLFQDRLNHLGYPGSEPLHSKNYQCLNRFRILFEEFLQLGLISPLLTQKEALEAFRSLTQNTIFQAQKKNARIQILGLLEASGCEFDSLWVSGLSDQCLPQKTALSAFIPHRLQKELFMPHSVPGRELLFAKQILYRLQQSSPEVILSYAQFQGEARSLPCSLITHFPAFKRLQVLTPPKAPVLIRLEESYQIPLKDQEQSSGGTALLANQAQCPFKAFAAHRLKAEPTLKLSESFSAQEQGQSLHKIMELVWGNLESQANLLAIEAEKLNQLIEESIETALKPLREIHADSFPQLSLDIEKTRLKKLVLDSLEWEKTRPSFSIASLEQSFNLKLGTLDFKVRIDRLDQVGTQKWVIDYKSSLPPTKPWNEDRPKAPQLLLYALVDAGIKALLLVQLKTAAILCQGLSEDPHNLPGLTPLKKGENWEERKAQWQQQLTLLAQEFSEGHCIPKPLSLSLCQLCSFQNLCRFSSA